MPGPASASCTEIAMTATHANTVPCQRCEGGVKGSESKVLVAATDVV